jgi:hypothetical protein
MRRRDVLQFLVSTTIAVPCIASAQTTPKTYRLASFTSGAPMTAESPNGRRLIPTLAQHGYELGKNLDYRAQVQICTLTGCRK